MNKKSNTERIFKDLVGVLSRCEKSTKTGNEYDLLVYVSFNEAALGGNPDDKVSFKLKLFKAEFLVIVEDSSLQVDEDSILMNNPSHNREIEEKGGQSSQTSLEGSINIGMAPKLAAKAGNKENLETGYTQRYSAGCIDYSYHPPIDKKQHLWLLKPYLNEPHLQGNVWNKNEKLLTLIDRRNNPDHDLPSVKIIIKCRREHLDIIDPKYSKMSLPFTKSQADMVTEMIKDALIENGLADNDLYADDISHDYATIPLADILVETK